MRGGTRKRGGTWTWYVDVVDPATSKRRQLTKGGFRTKREAQAALNDAVAALRTASFVEPSKMTLGAFLSDQWLPTIRTAIRPNTWTTYRIYAETHVIPTLGKLPLQAVSALHLNQLYADLAAHGRRDGRGGLAPKSIRHVHVLLHKALGDALRWGLVARNVAAAADPPRVPRRQRAVWSAEELGTFLRLTADDRLGAMWLLFATTGMRRSEILGLPWWALDLEARPGGLQSHRRSYSWGTSRSSSPRRRPKAVTGSSRSTRSPWQYSGHIGPSSSRSGLPGVRPGGHQPGLHRRGRLDPPPGARHPRRFARLVKDAGLPPITLHGVRHSYATAALAAGEPLKVVSERLGHTSTTITANLYQHVLPSMDERTANAVARLILGGEKQDSTSSAVRSLSTGPAVHEEERR